MKIFARIIDLRFIELAPSDGLLPVHRFLDSITEKIEVKTIFGPFTLTAGEYELIIFEK